MKVKNLKVQPRKDFYLYIILGSIFTIAGIIFFPLWADTNVFFASWGMSIVNLIICGAILVYLFTFLIKKVLAGGNGVIKALTIIEFALLLLIALGCILAQFNVINISEPCQIVGFALWCRGVIEIFRAYYHQHNSSSKYPLWWLCIAIAMVSFGMFLMLSSLFGKKEILWLFVIILLVIGIILIVYGILCAPKKAKKAKAK